MAEWWQGFFGGLWQEAQLRQWTDEDNRAAADKIERAMKLHSGSTVLDVPCGDGRISLELASVHHSIRRPWLPSCPSAEPFRARLESLGRPAARSGEAAGHKGDRSC
jgi:hypothetical protein